MKKLLIFINIIFIITIASLNAGCPPGYERRSISGVFMYEYQGQVFTCHITVFFCCKWDVELHTVVVEIDYLQSTYSDECIRWIPKEKQGELFDWVMLLISNNSENLCLLEYPPCDHPTRNYYTLSVKRPLCFYWKNEYIPPYPGEEPIWKLRILKCSEDVARCVEVWRICYNYSYNPPRIQKIFISRQIEGQPWYCNQGKPDLPPDGKTWEEAWETDCYFFSCN